MECTCIRQTELPNTSKLFADLVYYPERVRNFYPYSPHDPESYVSAAKQVNLSPDRRAALVAALREQNGPSASLDLLAQPDTVAVVTGQQVGLFFRTGLHRLQSVNCGAPCPGIDRARDPRGTGVLAGHRGS